MKKTSQKSIVSYYFDNVLHVFVLFLLKTILEISEDELEYSLYVKDMI